MRLCICASLAASALLLSAAVGAAEADGKWSRCKHAHYKAHQLGDQVVLVAYGTHPTAGYDTKLRRLPIEIYPPQFECVEQKPAGFVAQVITPFAEIAHFEASGVVKSVVIHDGKGEHAVELTRASGSEPVTEDVEYLTPDGKLTARLVFTDSQSGFAGVTGYIWTIEPDGSWKRQTFLNDMVRQPDQIGRLSKDQLKRLAGALRVNRLHKLPERLGSKPMVNPKSFKLAFGGKSSQLVLRGGGQLPKVNPEARNRSDVDRFVLIVSAIEKLLGAKSEG